MTAQEASEAAVREERIDLYESRGLVSGQNFCEMQQRAESAETKIEALEQQILLIQSNASANYSAAENRTHAVEEELARVQGSLTDEIKIVSRIWDALGVTTYADAHGKEISQIVADTVAELGVTNRALELMCNDFNILEIHASQKFPSTVSDYLVAAREEKLKEVGQ